MLAVFMHAFWPLLGHVRAAAPATVQVICSVHGTMEMQLDEAPSRGDSLCAMCGAAGTALVSSLFHRATPDVIAHAEPSPQQLARPSQRAPHSLSSPRAPPQAS